MQAYLFDIDGTLILSGGAGKAAMEAALCSTFGVREIMDGVPFSGRTDRAIARDLFSLHGVTEDVDTWPRFVTGYLEQLPRALAAHRGEVLPGIAGLLEHLAARPDVLVGLLTGNIREGARLKLAHYRIGHHFTFGGFGDHHLDRDDVAREALAVVRERVGKQGTALDDVWVIGDTPLDVQCARAIGARAVAVATGWHTPDELAAAAPDLLMPDFADPTPLLSRLGGGPGRPPHA